MTPTDPSALQHTQLAQLLALLQLASPALPVGGFAYSQGLERAIEDGIVHDAGSARRWIEDLLLLAIARVEAPLWLRAFDAWAAADRARFAGIDAQLRALRETAELRAESQQMGASLLRVLPALGVTVEWSRPISYPAAFALASAGLGLQREAALAAFLWAWLETQVLVAVKSVPLGQQAGQHLLSQLQPTLLRAVSIAAALDDAHIGSAALGFALASARHETQYSRLYRS